MPTAELYHVDLDPLATDTWLDQLARCLLTWSATLLVRSLFRFAREATGIPQLPYCLQSHGRRFLETVVACIIENDTSTQTLWRKYRSMQSPCAPEK
jgi:hypothetical protein